MLRRRDAGESDRRLTLLTAEQGLVDVVAKGARKSGSRLSGMSEPLSVSTISIAAGKKIRYVTQSQPITSFPELRLDYDRLMIAQCLTEICCAVIPHGQPAQELFQHLVHSLRYLEVHHNPTVVLLWSELKLMELCGLLPRWMLCAVTDVPIQEQAPFVSPSGGGYISMPSALEFRDRSQVTKEHLIGLAKMAELEVPPEKFKKLEDSLSIIFGFWRHFTDSRLIVNEQFLGTLKLNGV